MRASILLIAAVVPVIAQDTSLVRESEPLTPAEEAKRFRLPPGFSAQLVASEPVVNKPMNLAFDEKGRLWCTSSAEYPWAVKKDQWATPEGQLKESRDKILVFSDEDRDGVVETPTVFADNLNIPTGVLPYGNGCIAWSIPNIWRLEDTDGDGKCDKRTVLFGPLGWEMDTHGMISSLRMGMDGWVYATHGFNNTSHFEVRAENNAAAAGRVKKPTPSAGNTGVPRGELDWGYSLDLHSGNVFRFRPDGSAVEPYSWGQVNPFGLAQDSWGNFYTADCHSNPITQLIAGAFYPSFGKPHDGLGFAPVMCEHAHGSTGLCGVLYIDGGIWGAEWEDHMLVGNCVTSRINHDAVRFTGATPKAEEREDFMVSEDPWFRPVDLRLGPDGSLYVADFYNRIIGHYEVPLTHPGRDRERGRIWRIVKEGAKGQREMNFEKDAVMRRRFTGPEKSPSGGGSRMLAATAEWITMHPGEKSSWTAAVLAESLEKTAGEDASLRQTLKVALRARLQEPGGFEGLEGMKPTAGLAAVIRTMQTPEASAWTLNYLLSEPQADRGELRNTVASLARNLPGDGEAKLVGFVRKTFADDHGAQLELAGAIRQGLARRGGEPGVEAKAWLGEVAVRLFAAIEGTAEGTEWVPAPGGEWVLQKRPCADGREATLLSSLGSKGEGFAGVMKSAVFSCPDKFAFWVNGHRGRPEKEATERTYVRLVEAEGGAELVRAYPPRNDTAQRVEWELAGHAGKRVRFEIVDEDDNDKGEAYAWLAAGRFEPGVIALPSEDGDGFIRTAAGMASELKLTGQIPVLAKLLARKGLNGETRSAVATALAAMNQPQAIAAVLKTAPAALQGVLAEILAGSAEGAAALMDCGVPVLLTQPVVAQKLAALNNAVLSERAAAMTKGLPPANEETAALIAARIRNHAGAAKDLAAGQALFKVHCAVCHRMGGEGNVVGPQLDGVGNRGVERLCEDILDPHRAVDPNFRMHVVTKKDGGVLAGLVRRDEKNGLTLVDAAGQETTVARDQVAKDEAAVLSLMPATFGASLTEAEFHALVAWLATQKAEVRSEK